MLGLLVDTFGNFVREIHVPIEAIEAQVGFPEDLHDFRDAVGHHLILLLLLARTDRDFAQCEEETIITHCVAFARLRGVACNEARTAAFREYATSFRPSLMQLDPALARLSKCDHGEFEALVDAAHALVAADGVSRPEEVKFLSRLKSDLSELPVVSSVAGAV